MSHSKKYFGLKGSEGLGRHLKSLRENMGLGQAEAARRVGISPGQLNYFERGTRPLHDSILIKLAQLYHVSPEDILAEAHWPQLILLPLISIINPEQLPENVIEELERGLEEDERKQLTEYIEQLLKPRSEVL